MTWFVGGANNARCLIVGESGGIWNKIEDQKGDVPSPRESHIMW